MANAFPQWKGFESAPQGHLLDQVVELSGSMGLAYERSIGFYKDFHVHDRSMIVLPRGACVMEVRVERPSGRFKIDCGSLMIVPRGDRHDDEGTTSVYDTMALYPSEAMIDAVAAEEGIPKARARRAFSACRTFPRTRWLDQLASEYFYARVVSRRESAPTLAFLERQILVEVLSTALGRGKPREAGAREPQSDDVTARALRYIEANLFTKLGVRDIARQSFSSVSTLLRHFSKDLGKTPYAYIKARRLEEARRLIAEGQHQVGDVGMLVGYDNFASFSLAFKKWSGKPPSAFLPGRGRSPRRG